jgi:tetratricopeptide (TPR) repeat protein
MIIRILFLILLTIGVANSKSGDGGGSGGSGGGGSSSGGGGSSSGGGGSSGGSSGGANDGKDNAEWQLYKAEINAIIFDIKNEKLESAMLKAEAFVYENPDIANGWNYAGFAARKLKKYDDAERYYATGLEINPKHAGILSYQGELYLETGRLDMAKENLVKLNEYCNFNCTERNELRDAINKKIESVY